MKLWQWPNESNKKVKKKFSSGSAGGSTRLLPSHSGEVLSIIRNFMSKKATECTRGGKAMKHEF